MIFKLAMILLYNKYSLFIVVDIMIKGKYTPILCDLLCYFLIKSQSSSLSLKRDLNVVNISKRSNEQLVTRAINDFYLTSYLPNSNIYFRHEFDHK